MRAKASGCRWADQTVPHAVAHAAYRRQRRNPGITEFQVLSGRGHSLVIDSGWREVADVALSFVERHHPPIRAATPAETRPARPPEERGLQPPP